MDKLFFLLAQQENTSPRKTIASNHSKVIGFNEQIISLYYKKKLNLIKIKKVNCQNPNKIKETKQSINNLNLTANRCQDYTIRKQVNYFTLWKERPFVRYLLNHF